MVRTSRSLLSAAASNFFHSDGCGGIAVFSRMFDHMEDFKRLIDIAPPGDDGATKPLSDLPATAGRLPNSGMQPDWPG